MRLRDALKETSQKDAAGHVKMETVQIYSEFGLSL